MSLPAGDYATSHDRYWLEKQNPVGLIGPIQRVLLLGAGGFLACSYNAGAGGGTRTLMTLINGV